MILVLRKMSDLSLNIEPFLLLSARLPVIDVRSPAEYHHAHFPGAVSMPLFSNEERSVIGTLYLQKGSKEAMVKGLEYIGPRMKDYALAGSRIAPGGEALMYCWRGGMRSNSMAWLMNTVGIRTSILTGGYKTFRKYVLDYFRKNLNLVVIGGMTGSGKTAVLESLESNGAQVIHLERLARHKGSVFGSVNMPEQPSSEQFENELFAGLYKLDYQKPVFIEDESLAIGKVFIPRDLYDQMSVARFINLEVSVEARIEMLLDNYTGGDTTQLVDGVRKLEKRLGKEKADRAIEMIKSNNLADAIAIVLKYYDKIYSRSMSQHQRKEAHVMTINTFSAEDIADSIMNTIGT
ncbi:MAG TPA: tRNA 2-selenouridine(34) synthase MnmH [Bacteroidales bacterium]|nr:tRNA 2-selenouridine(34) synthase MnmH [Bacteroidales bacterium]